MTRLLTLLVAAALVGCSSPVDLPRGSESLNRGEVVSGVSMSVAETSYTIPDNVSVTLRNDSRSRVGYNTCLAVRDRWEGSSWRQIAPFRVCTLIGYDLEPGREITFEEAITDEWQPGEYRISLSVSLGSGQRATISSGTFRVAE